ncbi:hypothetical protein F4677DRAFT_457928 [Hypoxylon crocopeplum]|nr:hypothetical protein F4677DRAFT_457928 [Hypoxylon crocopeplum]
MEHIYAKVDTRFLYGKLRLGRLNILYRLSQGVVLRDFFHDNFGWLVSITVYIAIVLTAMQVGLATDTLGKDQSFQLALYGFTVFSIVGPLAATGLIVLWFCFIFVYNFVVTVAYKKKRFRNI